MFFSRFWWRPAGMLALAAGLLPNRAAAQAPAWTAASPNLPVATPGYVSAVATDASDNLFVAGAFAGTAVFGSTTLSSRARDWFVAKYVPSTGTWAWAVRAGGTGNDAASSIAVSGNNVYVCGYATNNLANLNAVTFSGSGSAAPAVTQLGASTNDFYDIVLAKYTDNGTSATLGWTQVAGGTSFDQARALAANGSSVYLTGSIYNDRSNAEAVVFGGSGSTPGTVAVAGASTTRSDDIVLAKYTDNGATATLGWTQVAGGTDDDEGRALAVRGSSIYLAGHIVNNTANATGVQFGPAGSPAGTSPQYGASATSSQDIVLAKYTDSGATATLGWTQVAGGTGADYGFGLTVGGNNSVYLTGGITNNAANAKAVVLGGSGATPGTQSQSGVAAATSIDVLVARYVDNTTSATCAWSQVAGGGDLDYGAGLAVSGPRLLVGCTVVTPASFGSIALTGTGFGTTYAVAELRDPALPTRPAADNPAASLRLAPNPARGLAALSGAAPGAAVQVLDARGRQVATATADASGMAPLPLTGLAPGLYLVRAQGTAARLAVE